METSSPDSKDISISLADINLKWRLKYQFGNLQISLAKFNVDIEDIH